MRYNPQRVGGDPVITTFLDMCSMTTPHGYESYCWRSIPGPKQIDKHGNVHVLVGSSPIMFACHLDTADHTPTRVWFDFRKDGFVRTNGATILGADDKAGASIMCHMIRNRVPGHYVFHAGEEVGCVGSRALAEAITWGDWDKELLNGGPLPSPPSAVISFDRRGYDSVVTHQMGSRCCSDGFSQALCDVLGLDHQPDPSGVYTDSAQYAPVIPECTNISVGYFNQHACSESQDLRYLREIADRCVIADWRALPILRDPDRVDHDALTQDELWFDTPPNPDEPTDYEKKCFSELFTSSDYTEAVEVLTYEGYSRDEAEGLIEWHGLKLNGDPSEISNRFPR
jgi:hypothetical protein